MVNLLINVMYQNKVWNLEDVSNFKIIFLGNMKS